jgi:hypothetical protein
MSNANRLTEIARQLKNLSSIKTNLKKQQLRKDYHEKLAAVTTAMDALQDERRRLQPPKHTVTTITQEQVADLDYDETVRAIKSIQSKKTRSQYSEDREPYESAIRIEQMLLAHKETLKPSDRSSVRLSTIREILEIASQSPDPLDYITKALNELLTPSEP